MSDRALLAESLVFPILLALDLEASRAFYHGVLGLPVLKENEERILFGTGSGGMVSLTHSTVGTKDTQTQLAWRVSDIHAAVDDLRARGIRIEAYEAPDPVTDADGIADMGYVWAAWFLDPSGNVLAVVEPKE